MNLFLAVFVFVINSHVYPSVDKGTVCIHEWQLHRSHEQSLYGVFYAATCGCDLETIPTPGALLRALAITDCAVKLPWHLTVMSMVKQEKELQNHDKTKDSTNEIYETWGRL
jgi:hypothetical protein